MPPVQNDRVVVRMTHGARRIQLRVAHHLTPATLANLSRRQQLELRGVDPRRVSRVDEHGLAAAPERVLQHMRLAESPRQRLVTEHRTLVHLDRPLRQEEPLTLPHIRGIAATEAISRPHTSHSITNRIRLKRILGGNDAADTTGELRDRRDEPMPLVKAAEELALLTAVPHEQKQAAFIAVRVDDDDSLSIARHAQGEELATAINIDVDPRSTTHPLDLHASTDHGETPLENLVHEVSPL